MARGRLRLGSRTSSAMLTSPSKPRKAKTASKVAPASPAATAGLPIGGTASGRRVTSSGPDQTPAAISSSSPPTSISVMTPANTTDSLMPQAAIAPMASTTSVMRTPSGSGRNTPT